MEMIETETKIRGRNSCKGIDTQGNGIFEEVTFDLNNEKTLT